MEMLGPEALLFEAAVPGGHTRAQDWMPASYLASTAASIASGTSEILRGIIAMQVLGLPRGA
jgi:alkylation response protein AidB-like acyl-CoA dehydrogenase